MIKFKYAKGYAWFVAEKDGMGYRVYATGTENGGYITEEAWDHFVENGEIVIYEQPVNNIVHKTTPSDMLMQNKIIAAVANRLEQQQIKGLQKYGQLVDPAALSFNDWLEHLQQELTDALVYAECLRERGASYGLDEWMAIYRERDELRTECDKLRAERDQAIYDVERMKAERDEALKTVDKQSIELARLENESNQALRALDELRHRFGSTSRALESSQEKVRGLSRELNDVIDANERLAKRPSSEELSTLMAENSEWEHTCKKLTVERDKARGETRKLMDVVKRIKDAATILDEQKASQ